MLSIYWRQKPFEKNISNPVSEKQTKTKEEAIDRQDNFLIHSSQPTWAGRRVFVGVIAKNIEYSNKIINF